MSENIVLNKQHIVSKNNNKLTYTFNSPITLGKDDTIALSSLSIYNSWFNISAANNNNHFKYKWWDMSGNLTVLSSITITDGYYSVDTLYEYLQQEMVKNNHYLETASGSSYIFFIEFLTNSTFYATEIRLSSASKIMDIGNGLEDIVTNEVVKDPVGWVLPDNFETPEVIIPSTNKFGELMGFSAQSISKDLTGDQTNMTNEHYSFLNDNVPNMIPSSSIIVTCNVVSNTMSVPNDVLFSFSAGSTGIGDLITVDTDLVHCKCKAGTCRDISIELHDQDFNPLVVKDPNMLIVLSINRK